MTEERKRIRRQLSNYSVQKEELKKLKRKLKNKKLKTYEKNEIKQQIELIEDYLDEANKVLNKFEELCGKDCLQIIKEIYVEGNKAFEVAEKHEMSRRKLEAYLTFWIDCYLENHKPLRKETPWTVKM